MRITLDRHAFGTEGYDRIRGVEWHLLDRYRRLIMCAYSRAIRGGSEDSSAPRPVPTRWQIDLLTNNTDSWRSNRSSDVIPTGCQGTTGWTMIDVGAVGPLEQ